MKHTRSMSARQFRGFSLVELLITLTVIAVLSVPLVSALARLTGAQRNAGIAQSAGVVHRAVQDYMTANAAFVASQATPFTITIPMLQSPTVYLDPAFVTTNAAGQVPSIRSLRAADGSVEVVIAYTGGQAIKDGDLDDIAAYLVDRGASGGSLQSGSGSIARGFQGSWVKDLAAFGLSPGPGHVVDFLTYGSSAIIDDSLHRTAHPENTVLNTMSTNILMGGNAITGLSNLQMNAANQGITFFGGGEHIVGTADFGIGFQTNGGTERMRLYNDGHLGLNTYLALPAGNGISAGGSWYYGDATNLALRPGANGGTVFLQGTANGGGTAHLNIAGNISGVNEVYANGWYRLNGATGLYWQAYGGGWMMQDGSWIRSYGDKGIYTGGQVQAGSLQSNSTIVAAGRITSNEYILPAGGANVGWGCDRVGLIGQLSDGSGKIVSCVGGIWKLVGGSSHTWYLVANVVNQTVFGHNYTSEDMYVSAVSNGTSCGTQNNDYSAVGVVSGFQVASNQNNNTDGYQQRSMGFMVPAGTDYQVVWVGKYKCNTQTVVYEFRA